MRLTWKLKDDEWSEANLLVLLNHINTDMASDKMYCKYNVKCYLTNVSPMSSNDPSLYESCFVIRFYSNVRVIDAYYYGEFELSDIDTALNSYLQLINTGKVLDSPSGFPSVVYDVTNNCDYIR